MMACNFLLKTITKNCSNLSIPQFINIKKFKLARSTGAALPRQCFLVSTYPRPGRAISLLPPSLRPPSRRAAGNPSSTDLPLSSTAQPGGGDGGGAGGGRAGRRGHGRRAPRRHHPAPARGADRAPREAGAALRGGDPPALHRLPRHLPQPAQPARARGADQDLRCVPALPLLLLLPPPPSFSPTTRPWR